MVASSRGQSERAVRLFGAAEALGEAMGTPQAPSNRAAFAPDLADARRRLGEGAFAAAWAGGCAMTLDEATAYALAGEAEGATPDQRPSAGRQRSPLTRREREVASLIAQGSTNHEIADELVVSQRTVEAHVANILAKLGFTSRAQVAAWAVEHGLPHSQSHSAD